MKTRATKRRRPVQIIVRCTPAEAKVIRENAKAAGLPVSALLRKAATV